MNILSRPAILAMIAVALAWSGCYGPYVKLIDQPPVAQPNDTISIAIMVGQYGIYQENKALPAKMPFREQVSLYTRMLYSRDAGNYPVFSVCLPEGCLPENRIPYLLDRDTLVLEGSLYRVNHISQTLESWYPKPGYAWWSYLGDIPYLYNERDMSLNLEIILPDDTAEYFIDYAFGYKYAESFDTLPGEIYPGEKQSFGHYLTTDEPEHYVVTSDAPSGPGTLEAALSSIENYGIITFDLTKVPMVLTVPSMDIGKPFWIKGDADQPLTLKINGGFNLYLYEPRAKAKFSDVNIQCMGTTAEPVISFYTDMDYGTPPLIFDNVRFANNIRASDLIYSEYGNLDFHNCSFMDNQFDHLVHALTQVTRVSNCAFSGNQGGYMMNLYDAGIDICNTVFRDSISPLFGEYCDVTLKNISYAGLYPIEVMESNLSLYNSILWGTMGFQLVHWDLNGTGYPCMISHSNIRGSSVLGNVTWLEGNIDEDPLFMASGEDWCCLQAGSPCIDAGTHEWPGWPVYPWDLAGNTRIWDGDGDGVAVIDMGAYEFASLPVGAGKFRVPDSGFRVQVFPNPFRDKVMIGFDTESAAMISIIVYNSQGMRLETLAGTKNPAGSHRVEWEATGLPAGIYLLRIQMGNTVMTEKLIKN